MGCGRFVKVLLDQELIITSGREVTVQYSLACEEAGCFPPVSSPYLVGLHAGKAGDVETAVHHRRVHRHRRPRG
jgi:hypothetical protein